MNSLHMLLLMCLFCFKYNCVACSVACFISVFVTVLYFFRYKTELLSFENDPKKSRSVL